MRKVFPHLPFISANSFCHIDKFIHRHPSCEKFALHEPHRIGSLKCQHGHQDEFHLNKLVAVFEASLNSSLPCCWSMQQQGRIELPFDIDTAVSSLQWRKTMSFRLTTEFSFKFLRKWGVSPHKLKIVSFVKKSVHLLWWELSNLIARDWAQWELTMCSVGTLNSIMNFVFITVTQTLSWFQLVVNKRAKECQGSSSLLQFLFSPATAAQALLS